MRATGYLVDTSAFTRLSRNTDLQFAWREEAAAGRLAICPVTELEVLYSARSKAHRDQIRTRLHAIYAWVVCPDPIFTRASAVQDALIDKGVHRSAGPVDLLVAATAEAHGLSLLHYDGDFTHIAAVTGQPVRWIAEPGSID